MKLVAAYRIAVIAGVVALLEALCATGVIDKITMQAPHLIVRDLWRMLVSGRVNGAIRKTLENTIAALLLALGVGIVAGAAKHSLFSLCSSDTAVRGGAAAACCWARKR